MVLKDINEKQVVEFARNLLDYYSNIDRGFSSYIYTIDQEESLRNNVGWYNYDNGKHKVHINIPNIMCATTYFEEGILNTESFYAFLTLCVGHEYRHFLQGKCIYEGKEIDGYGQNDVFYSELMLYIRYFFDAYYLLNKGNIKYELDAEKFAIVNGVEFLKDNYPDIDADKVMTEAVNFYANIQSCGFVSPTLPLGNENINEIIIKLTDKLSKNFRYSDLRETLFVYNPRFYDNHTIYGLDEDKLLTHKLVEDYSVLSDGSKQDLLVVKQILSLLKQPNDSLEQFPHIRKRYLEKKL